MHKKSYFADWCYDKNPNIRWTNDKVCCWGGYSQNILQKCYDHSCDRGSL